MFILQRTIPVRGVAQLADDIGFVGQQAFDNEAGGLYVKTVGGWQRMDSIGPGARGVVLLAQSGVASSVTSTTEEATLGSVIVPANMMGPSGCLRIHSQWTYSNSANTKNIRASFGEMPIIQLAGAAQSSVTFLRSIRNRNSMTAQVLEAVGSSGASTSSGTSTVLNVDTSRDQAIRFTAQLTDVSDQVTLEGFTVEVLNP